MCKRHFDIILMTSGILMYIITYLIDNSSFISLISGISGIVAVILCSQRKPSQFIWSFIQLFTYVYLVYQEKLYGKIIENGFYFITMLFGIYVWVKNYNIELHEIDVKKLSNKTMSWIVLITIFCILILYGYLKDYTDDPQPLIDSVSTVPAFVGQILLILRYRENWFFWLTIDIASIIMWANVGNWIMVMQFILWSINCIYGLYKWNRI